MSNVAAAFLFLLYNIYWIYARYLNSLLPSPLPYEVLTWTSALFCVMYTDMFSDETMNFLWVS